MLVEGWVIFRGVAWYYVSEGCGYTSGRKFLMKGRKFIPGKNVNDHEKCHQLV